MKKKQIIGRLILCCIILITAIGTVFAKKFGEERDSKVFTACEYLNIETFDKKSELEHTGPCAVPDYENESIKGEHVGFLEGLIVAPVLITKSIVGNQVLVSSNGLENYLYD